MGRGASFPSRLSHDFLPVPVPACFPSRVSVRRCRCASKPSQTTPLPLLLACLVRWKGAGGGWVEMMEWRPKDQRTRAATAPMCRSGVPRCCMQHRLPGARQSTPSPTPYMMRSREPEPVFKAEGGERGDQGCEHHQAREIKIWFL